MWHYWRKDLYVAIIVDNPLKEIQSYRRQLPIKKILQKTDAEPLEKNIPLFFSLLVLLKHGGF